MIDTMPRCETCGRVLTRTGSNEDISDGGKSLHFCSVQCKATWKETIRKVSVSH